MPFVEPGVPFENAMRGGREPAVSVSAPLQQGATSGAAVYNCFPTDAVGGTEGATPSRGSQHSSTKDPPSRAPASDVFLSPRAEAVSASSGEERFGTSASSSRRLASDDPRYRGSINRSRTDDLEVAERKTKSQQGRDYYAKLRRFHSKLPRNDFDMDYAASVVDGDSSVYGGTPPGGGGSLGGGTTTTKVVTRSALLSGGGENKRTKKGSTQSAVVSATDSETKPLVREGRTAKDSRETLESTGGGSSSSSSPLGDERTASRDSGGSIGNSSAAKNPASTGKKWSFTGGLSAAASRSWASSASKADLERATPGLPLGGRESRGPSKTMQDAAGFKAFLDDTGNDVKKMARDARSKGKGQSLMKNYKEFFLLVSKYSPDDTETLETLDAMYHSNEANQRCFDCLIENPQWCSLNLGIWICSSCSGHHRSFGTHISRVKSAALDHWTPDNLRWMRAGGNHILEELVARYVFPDWFTVHELYHTKVLDWYRQYLAKKVENGRPDPDMTPPEKEEGAEMMDGFRPAAVSTLPQSELRQRNTAPGAMNGDHYTPGGGMNGGTSKRGMAGYKNGGGSDDEAGAGSSSCCFPFGIGRKKAKGGKLGSKSASGFHELASMIPMAPNDSAASSGGASAG
eukprot:g178.t1